MMPKTKTQRPGPTLALGAVSLDLQRLTGPELTRLLQTLQAEVRRRDAGDAPGGDAATSERGDFQDLADWTADSLKLKGLQLRLVELLIEHGGRLKLVDVLLRCRWTCADNFNRTKQRANRKLRAAGWRIERHNNEAILRPLQGGPK